MEALAAITAGPDRWPRHPHPPHPWSRSERFGRGSVQGGGGAVSGPAMSRPRRLEDMRQTLQAPAPPPHVKQGVRATPRLHAAHDRRATTLQKLVDRTTALFAHPWFIAAV